MVGFNSVPKSQTFILIMRWVIIGISPILFGVSGLWPHTYDLLTILVFSFVTTILTICYFKHLSLKPVHWGLIHIVDLMAITLMVLGQNGIHSESFNLYYLVVLQAGLIFGVRQALVCLFFSNILYTGAVMFASSAEADIKRLIVRILYSWLVGITGAYLIYLENKHQKHAIMDCLTSTYNRSFLDQSLRFEFKRAINCKTNLSVIMIDIDNFKTVNDLYGHKVGDLVLEQVARIIQSNIRDVDFVARYGGEEFFVTLPGIGCDKAHEVAERIRNAVEGSQFNKNNPSHINPVTISCGVASYPVQAENLDELMKRADDYLYEAKRAGRNRVHRAS
ncbi:MAG: GGDEF domain-containing protein [Eubacteriales bacterium]